MFLLAQANAQQNAEQTGRVIGALFGALVVGLLCGLVVKKLTDSREQSVLGWVGFVACTIAGFLFGLVGGIPMAIVFTIIVFATPSGKKAKKSKRSDSESASYRRSRPPAEPYDI